MATKIWTQCNGINHIRLLNETAWRIIESQEMTATRKLVDSFDEQIILDDMIESNKPRVAKEYSNFHSLLYTPFRYPPLKHGSRFGKKMEPSLWYGSLELNVAMSEKAFYLFNFLRASKAKYGIVEQPLTIFSTLIKTDRGIKLSEPPFSKYTSLISSPDSYEISQRLGSAMREANIQAFTYKSARDAAAAAGINIALFTPKAFGHKKPNITSFQSWQCIANNHLIEFSRLSSITRETTSFSVDQFMLNGTLPFPAN